MKTKQNKQNIQTKKPVSKQNIIKELNEELEKETVEVINLMNPAFDPDIPEQKQRWLR